MRSITIGNQKINCSLRRSRKARRACLRLNPGNLEIIAPAGMSDSDILNFVRSNQAWLEDSYQQQLRRLDERVRPPVWKVGATSGQIAYLGRMCECQVLYRPGRRAAELQIHEDRLVLSLSQELRQDRPEQHLKRALIEKFAGMAAEFAGEHGRRHRLYPRSLRIREQKTRWGSCGIHGDINLNWRLIHAPQRVIEYVVIHELCHLQQRNHSARFWALVADHMSDYAGQRAWLHDNGATLMQPFP